MDAAHLPHEERLSAFIRSNIETILEEWEAFARGIVSARHMDATALRDHASGMLLAIADDLDRSESMQEQHEQSWAASAGPELQTEAQQHGAGRVAGGFTFNETMSEFRALRASVLRLWLQSQGRLQEMPLDDSVRFNEAIDQALTESMQRYALDKEENTRRFDTLLSSSPDLQAILSPDGHFIYLNRALAKLFGHTHLSAVGRSVEELCPTMSPSLMPDVARAIAGMAPVRGELRCSALPGPAVSYRYVLIAVRNKQGAVESVTFSARDISELKASEDKILRHAYYDSLTDLPNRMLFRDRLEQEVRHAGRTGRMIALLYIDLQGRQ